MIPVAGDLVGSCILGLSGAGADWQPGLVHAKLKNSGDLDMRIKGLVLASDSTNPEMVPPPKDTLGVNPMAMHP